MWAKYLSRYLTERHSRIASKHMKRCSMSLVTVAQTTHLFSKVVIPIYILTRSADSSSCSPPHQHLISLFNFSHSDGCMVVSYCGLCFFFSLYKINIYFKHKCMVVNSTVQCHRLCCSYLGNTCSTPFLLYLHRQTTS